MQILWLDGAPVPHTPRQELRLALRSGRTMNEAEHAHRRGLMSAPAFDRFERLWAITTATEHPRTVRMPLKRWSTRRARACAAVRAFLSTPAPQSGGAQQEA